MVPTNLPLQLTSFVGRAAEVAAVDELLGRARLVTLTGPGGAGKTRLAWQVATGRGPQVPDGIWWVELAALAVKDSSDGREVADAVAEACRVPVDRVRGPLRSLTRYLAGQRLLVVLDNAEHLLDAVAEVAETLLRSCPEVTVLVTSREPLGVPGEAVWRVPPLTDDDAVALFVDRASHVRPGFVLDPAGEAVVQAIATHLDGIPLALELAAAWLRTLAPQQILAGLDDRFTLLVRGPRGAQRRQQTLAASIDWSHALLDPLDRAVFRRLAVFAGSFSLEATQAICAGDPVPDGTVLAALGRLVDKSLVVAEDHAASTRYRLLETLRGYAAARLVEVHEDAPMRDRHLVWFTELAETLEPELERDLDGWRARLEPERENLRGALERGLAAPAPDPGRRLAAALAWLWHLDGRGREGLAFLRRAVDRAPGDRSRLQARLLTGIALVADTADPLDVEYDAAARALDVASEVGDEGLRALCLSLKAVGAFYTDFTEAWQLCDEAVRAADVGANGFARAGARALQAMILSLRDRHTEADARFDELLPTLLRRHRGVAATALGYQATGALAVGDVPRARTLAEDAVRVAEPLGDLLRVGMARSALAFIHAAAGSVDRAQATIDPVLRLVEGVDGEVFVAGLARAMAMLALRRGDAEAACDWLGREAATTDRGEPTWAAAQASAGLGTALALLGRDGEAAAALDRAEAVARRRGMPAVLAEALEARAALAARDPDAHDRATELHHAALAARVQHGLCASIPDSLEGLVTVGVASRPAVEDVRLLGAAAAGRAAMGLPRMPHRQAGVRTASRALRAVFGAAAFEAAWAEGADLTLAEAATLASRARGTRRRPATGWASLTPTELEVVRAVADGLTNPEIGARLFMSRGTVKTHLTHIFTKLDVGNRTELATIAAGRSEFVAGRRLKRHEANNRIVE